MKRQCQRATKKQGPVTWSLDGSCKIRIVLFLIEPIRLRNDVTCIFADVYSITWIMGLLKEKRLQGGYLEGGYHLPEKGSWLDQESQGL